MAKPEKNRRKEVHPVQKFFIRHWGKSLYARLTKVMQSTRTQAQRNIIDAWGTRLDTILLKALSKEEHTSLAEHIKTCSACAADYRESSLIEELAERYTQSHTNYGEELENRISTRAKEKYNLLFNQPNKKQKEREEKYILCNVKFFIMAYNWSKSVICQLLKSVTYSLTITLFRQVVRDWKEERDNQEEEVSIWKKGENSNV